MSTASRIRRGMAFLDKHRPGWIKKIDLDQLDLGWAACCVIGQVEGDFWNACDPGGLISGFPLFRTMGSRRLSVEDLGFIDNDDSDRLTKLWKEAIKARLEQEGV